MELVSVKIKIKNNELEFDEKTDLIVESLRALADKVEELCGDVQQLNVKDEDSSIEYLHLATV